MVTYHRKASFFSSDKMKKERFTTANKKVQWSKRQQRMSALTEEQSRARAEGMKLALLLQRAVHIIAIELLWLNLWKLNFLKCRTDLQYDRTARVQDARKMWRRVRFWQQLRLLYGLYFSSLRGKIWRNSVLPSLFTTALYFKQFWWICRFLSRAKRLRNRTARWIFFLESLETFNGSEVKLRVKGLRPSPKCAKATPHQNNARKDLWKKPESSSWSTRPFTD